MLILVVHQLLQRIPYGVYTTYSPPVTATPFADAAHAYYFLSNKNFFLPQSCIFASCLYPIFTDPTNILIESCGTVNNITNRCMYFPFIFYLYLIYQSTVAIPNSRCIHIVSVMVHIRTPRFNYIIYTF